MIILIFVWKPFDKKDDKSSDSTSPQSADATSPSGVDIPDETGSTPAPTLAPATIAPTQQPYTLPPTEAPTDAPDGSYTVTYSDRLEIQQLLSEMIDYGYSAANAKPDECIALTYEYNFCLDTAKRKELYDDFAEISDSQIADFKEEFGDDYEITATVTDIEVYSDDDIEDGLEYYSDEYDISGIETVVAVYADLSITGSKDSESDSAGFTFFKVNGQWYPMA